jgi:bla regulator protein blaR1
MTPDSFSPVANHLWQSTLFAAVAGLLTLALRRNSARVRHWIWVAASLKFLVPFSVLIGVGSRVQWRTVDVPADSALSATLDQLTQPFANSANALPVVATAPVDASVIPEILWTVWVCGFIGFGWSWWIRWYRIRAAVRAGSPVLLDVPIKAISSPSFLEPGVFGVFRPILMLPDGIFTHLTSDQWKSVVAHELCHVRHRDNLVALVHMSIETVFWFHPLVWWIGRRIVQEREKACDEEVMRLGSEPRSYAQGILKVCELYLESPLTCVAGVSGSNLKRRIEDIMTNRRALELNIARRAALALAGLTAVVLPLVVGMVTAPHLRAQSEVVPRFEVASIKPIDATRCDPLASQFSPGKLHMCGALAFFIQTSYDLYTKGRGFNPGVLLQKWTANIEGAPAWLNSDLYQIEAKAEGTAPYAVMAGPMLQALFEARLKLKAHRETRNVPVYELVATKGGPTLQRADDACVPFDPVKASEPASPDQAPIRFCGGIRIGNGTLDFLDMTMSDFTQYLGHNIVDRLVINKVEAPGRFNFHLEFAPDEATPRLRRSENQAGPSIFTAMQEQLGLRLERATGPHDVLVIDSVERPSPN